MASKTFTGHLITGFAIICLTFFIYDPYSFVRNCRGGDQSANFGGKTPQVHLIIIRE